MNTQPQHTPTPRYAVSKIDVDALMTILLSNGYRREAADAVIRAVKAHDEFREIIMALGNWMMGDYAPRAGTLFDDEQTWKEKVMKTIAKAESL